LGGCLAPNAVATTMKLLSLSLLASISFSPVLALPQSSAPTPDAPAPQWSFKEVGTSGILALESIIVSPTLALFFDRASNDTLQIDGHSAWGALFDLQTNKPSPLRLITNSFCASGTFLSNGTMVGILSYFTLYSLRLKCLYLCFLGQFGWFNRRIR